MRRALLHLTALLVAASAARGQIVSTVSTPAETMDLTTLGEAVRDDATY